jgi:hypothetical protein
MKVLYLCMLFANVLLTALVVDDDLELGQRELLSRNVSFLRPCLVFDLTLALDIRDLGDSWELRLIHRRRIERGRVNVFLIGGHI